MIAIAVIAWWKMDPQPSPPIAAPIAVARDSAVVTAIADSAARTVPPTELRHVTPDERKRISDQIATARAQPRPAPPTLGSNQMSSVEEVRDQLMAIRTDTSETIEACQHFAPSVTHFKADIALVSDPDVGTLVEANDPVLSGSDAAVPKEFSDCIRGQLQTLELPPLKTGDTFNVSFEFETLADQRD